MRSAARVATRQRAARDIVLQVAVRSLNLALGVLVTALVVRTLGSTRYGQWSTILATLALVEYLATFGADSVAVREAAASPEHEHEWLSAVVALRFVAVVPVVVISALAMLLLARDQQMLIAGLILIAAMPFGGVGALQLVFRLRVNNRVPMLVLTLRSVLWGVAVAIIFLRRGGLVPFAIALAITNAIGSIVQSLLALRLLERRPWPSRQHLLRLVRAAAPVGLAGMLVIAYARIDQLMVFGISGSRAAGLYGSVYNMLDQAHFIPMSILTTLAPVLAASWPHDRARLLRAARQTAELMADASFGALAFAAVAAAPVVRLIFGSAFAQAAPALPILGAAFVFISFGYLNGNLLVVLGLQRQFLRISLVALVINVVGNAALIPLVGFIGAAWMTLITEIYVCGAGMALIRRKLELEPPRPGRVGRAALAGIALAGVLVAVAALGGGLAGLIIAALIFYPALLFGLGAIGVGDLRAVVSRGAAA
ncbi:MAG TPA: flippase [Solirubrobacteraceae bacterium]|nr:flippase [Solirubrobacteraceae bacterium]